MVTIKHADGRTVSDNLFRKVLNQTIFWSDDRLCHWFFDFKYRGQWVSCKSINNEITKIIITVF